VPTGKGVNRRQHRRQEEGEQTVAPTATRTFEPTATGEDEAEATETRRFLPNTF